MLVSDVIDDNKRIWLNLNEIQHSIKVIYFIPSVQLNVFLGTTWNKKTFFHSLPPVVNFIDYFIFKVVINRSVTEYCLRNLNLCVNPITNQLAWWTIKWYKQLLIQIIVQLISILISILIGSISQLRWYIPARSTWAPKATYLNAHTEVRSCFFRVLKNGFYCIQSLKEMIRKKHCACKNQLIVFESLLT